MSRRSSGRPSRATVVAVSVVVVAVAAAGTAYAMTRRSGPRYRLASVDRSNLTQTVTEVGTISTVRQATLAFPVAGTVGRVSVALGQQVRAGATVATLDATSLRQGVVSDRAAVATARQKLASDESAQTAATTASASGSASGSGSGSSSGSALSSTSSTGDGAAAGAVHPHPSSSPSASRPAPGGHPTGSGSPHGSGNLAADVAAVHRAQHALTTAQARVDALLRGPVTPANPRVLTVDQQAVAAACASSTVTFTAVSDAHGILTGTVQGAAGLPVSLPGATFAGGAAVPASTVQPDGSYTFGSTAQPLSAATSFTVQLGAGASGAVAVGPCASALTTVEQDETAVADAEQAVSTDENTLQAALSTWAADLATSSSTSPGGSGRHGSSSVPTGSSHAGQSGQPGQTGTQSGTQSGRTGTQSGQSGQQSEDITPAQLVADQKEIDAARAELAVGRQDVTQATLTTPIAGTIAAVAVSAGDSVSAGSTTKTISILGTGQKAIETTVGIADVDLVKKGQRATVHIDGVTAPLSGRVTQIGAMNTSGTSGTSTTYPVTVVLASTTLKLFDGAGATVAIDVGTARRVLSVPVSAIQLAGTRDVVRLFRQGKVTDTVVQVGLVGAARVQIISGLTRGQRVVLADLSAAIPSSTTTTTRFGGGFGGGAGFTGGGGAGFTGGGGGFTGGR